MLSLPHDVEIALRRLLAVADSALYQQWVANNLTGRRDDQNDASNLVQQLTGLLYATWYCADPEAQTTEVILGRDDLASALGAAVASATRYQPGWVVMRSEHNGTCLAGYQNQTRELKPGEYANLSRPGLPVVPGDTVAAIECLQWTDASTGFWYLQSSLGNPVDPLARVYWNTSYDQVGFVLQELTQTIDAQRIPYSLKCPCRASDYARVDSLVVYFELARWPELTPIVQSVAQRVKHTLRERHPPLTQAIAPGVGFAEDPGTKESFGESRCRILAPAVLSFFSDSPASTEDALHRLSDALRLAGIAPERPWQNGGYNEKG